MAETPKNHLKPWTPSDNLLFHRLVRENTPIRMIALKLGRSVASLYSHAKNEGVSLKPTRRIPHHWHRK